MSSDEDYAAFLEKANQDTGAAAKVEQHDSSFAKTNTVDTEVPGPLKSLDAFYMSETDEPFEPVALEYQGSSIDKEGFGRLIGHAGEVEVLGLEEWNVKNQYRDVVEAVGKSGGGDVKVFRVAHGKTRCEYYVVVLVEGKVVGVKARAVET